MVQVYIMPWNGETFGLQQLTVGPGFHGDPAWSPSGLEIAIDADWGDYPAQQGIWIVPASDPDGVTQAEAQRVTAIPAGMDFDSEPQYSPNGQWIAFTRFKSCKFNERGRQAGSPHGCKAAIFRVHPDGTGSSSSLHGAWRPRRRIGRPTGPRSPSTCATAAGWDAGATSMS